MKDIYSRKNIIGFIFFIVVFICGIIAAAGDSTQNLIAVTWFGDMPSLLILLSFAGLTYIKKDKYEFHQLGSVLKKDIILGGWMGSIIRFVIYMNIINLRIN